MAFSTATELGGERIGFPTRWLSLHGVVMVVFCTAATTRFV
jgi:hypothetical protein